MYLYKYICIREVITVTNDAASHASITDVDLNNKVRVNCIFVQGMNNHEILKIVVGAMARLTSTVEFDNQ
jgi:hypothetical protein